MTLLVAFEADDGIVFGSDTQLTSGIVRSTAQKIHPLGSHIVWSASGDVALIQRVQELSCDLPNANEPLENLRDILARLIKRAVSELLNLDFRTDFTKSAEGLLRLHSADFLYADWRQGRGRILHIDITGTPEWIMGRWAASGSGDLFAHALLGKYSAVSLNAAQASLLTYKVIQEAIQVGAYGLGEPIDMWIVREKGRYQLDSKTLALIDDLAETVRRAEVELLYRPGVVEGAAPLGVSEATTEREDDTSPDRVDS